MKIVNLIEFRKLPAGTVYCKYKPCYFGELEMKGDTLEVDFYAASLIANVKWGHDSSGMIDILDNAVKTGDSFELEVDAICRDGYFEDDQLFGIYETNDIKQLIGKLEEAL
jgi:hypothetical protein